jgi:pyridoxamine 5'-phosphate oxidase
MSPTDATGARAPIDAVERARRDYALGSLDVTDVDPDPLRQLERWIADAVAAEVGEPNAMTLATVDADGLPDARIVLLRRITTDSLVWFTDRTSTKGEQLAATPAAALVLHWQPLERQVRLRGPVTPLDDARSDEYFASRPRGSQLSAWASSQSRTVASREDYERQVSEVEARFDGVEVVPRPPHWGGYELTPDEVEFWQGRRSRRHDRLRFRSAADAAAGQAPIGWILERLQP